MKRSGRYLVIVAAALALAACSLTRVAYNNATPVVTWMVDDYFDLQDSQKDFVRARLARALAWHRESELPEYRRFLLDVIARTQGEVTPDDAQRAYATMRSYYQRAVERLLPDMAEFIESLDAEQAATLGKRFEEQNAKAVKERMKGAPAERRERRAKRFAEYVEDWTGHLDAAQRQLIATHYAAMPEFGDEWFADHRFRQAETLSLLRAKLPREQTIAGLRRLLIDSESWRDPQYAAKMKQRDRQLFELVAALSVTLTPEQRKHIHKRLRGYLEDVSFLMAAN